MFPHCDNLFYLPFIFPPPLLVGSIAGPYSGNSSLFGQRTLTYNSSISLHWQSTTTALTRVAGCPFSFPTYRSSLFIWEKHCRPSLLLLFQSTEPLTSYFLLPGGPSRCGQEKPVTCVYLRLDRPPFNTRQHPVIHRSINWGRTGLEDVYIYIRVVVQCNRCCCCWLRFKPAEAAATEEWNLLRHGLPDDGADRYLFLVLVSLRPMDTREREI